MSNFIGRPPFSNSLWVGIETMQFHIAQTKIFLRTPSFPIQGVPMNNLAPMKNCPGGVQGNLNWMPGYIVVDSLFIVTPIVGFCNSSMFCCALLCVHSSFAIISMGKRELMALLCLYSWCLVIVVWLFLTIPLVCLQLWLWYFLILLTYCFGTVENV